MQQRLLSTKITNDYLQTRDYQDEVFKIHEINLPYAFAHEFRLFSAQLFLAT